MGSGWECEISRARGIAVTDSDLGATLWTADGIPVEAAYTAFRGADGAAGAGPAIVLAHGFTGALRRPALRRAAAVFARHAAVVTFSFRGHGASGGRSTVGDREVLDLAAAVHWARSLGHPRVITVGFSMGGSVAVRHAALYRPGPDRDEAASTDGAVRADGLGTGVRGALGAPVRAGARGGTEARGGTAAARGETTAAARGETAARGGTEARGGDRACTTASEAHEGRTDAHADAAVAVSAAARWYYRGTAPMRRLHWVVQRPLGRLVSRWGLRTRIHPHDWDHVPLPPTDAAAHIAPRPLLVVHGDRDPYFPLDHPMALARAAGPDCGELWIEPGFGHAENAAPAELLERIARWSVTAASARAPRSGPRREDRAPDAP